MPTRRLATKQRRGRQFSQELESFLAGSDDVITSEQGLRDLCAEVFMIRHVRVPEGTFDEFSPYEKKRLALLEQNYQAWRSKYVLELHRENARRAHCLGRFERLLEAGKEPGTAFAQAICPGPNSLVYGMPPDDPPAESKV